MRQWEKALFGDIIQAFSFAFYCEGPSSESEFTPHWPSACHVWHTALGTKGENSPYSQDTLWRLIRHLEYKAMCTSYFCETSTECYFYPQLGKSVVAKVKIPEGTILTLDMLTVKVGEPKGYPPEDIFSLVGKKVLVTIEEDDTIMEESVENHGKKIKS